MKTFVASALLLVACLYRPAFADERPPKLFCNFEKNPRAIGCLIPPLLDPGIFALAGATGGSEAGGKATGTNSGASGTSGDSEGDAGNGTDASSHDSNGAGGLGGGIRGSGLTGNPEANRTGIAAAKDRADRTSSGGRSAGPAGGGKGRRGG